MMVRRISGGQRFKALFWMWILYTGALFGCRDQPLPLAVCEVQGSQAVSPLIGEEVIIEGVVTLAYQGTSGDGFFVQDGSFCPEEHGPNGLLVLHERWISLVQPGDQVRIRGMVDEQEGMTVLRILPGQIQVLGRGSSVPSYYRYPTRMLAGEAPLSWEQLEGMPVHFYTLEVSELEPAGPAGWEGMAKTYGGRKLKLILTVEPSREPAGSSRIPDTLVFTDFRGVILETREGYQLLNMVPFDLPTSHSNTVGDDQAEKATPEPGIPGGRGKPGYPFAPARYDPGSPEIYPDTPFPTDTSSPDLISAGLLITEIMPNPAGAEPAGEWVEIFNPEKFGVDLSAYKIGDAASPDSPEGMVRFPEGSTIQSKDVIVVAGSARVFQQLYGFYPDFVLTDAAGPSRLMEAYPEWGSSRVQYSNTGDQVILLDGRDQMVDSVGYGALSWKQFSSPPPAPEQGNSLERFPPKVDSDTGRDWRERTEPSPGRLDRSPPTPTPGGPQPSPTGTDPGPTATPVPGFPRLSEVMADPVGPEPEGEWIEIYNPYSYAFPLDGYSVRDDLPGSSSEGYFLFPGGAFIPAGEVIILANQLDEFVDTYGFQPDFALDQSQDQAGEDRRGSFRLRNMGDEVYLVDQEGVLVDSMCYGDSPGSRCHQPVDRIPEGWSYVRSLEVYPGVSDPDWRGLSEPSPGEISSWKPSPTPTPALSSSPTLTRTLAAPSATSSPPGTRMYPTPTVQPTLPPSPDYSGLKISEVMIDPRGPDPGGEWVEIINLATVRVNLAGFRLGDSTGQDREGMKVFPAGSWLKPEGILVIANRGEDFLALYGFLPDYEIMDTLAGLPDLFVPDDGPTGRVAFRNSGDEIRLIDAKGGEVDSLAYGDSTFPGFQPPVPSPREGFSLERYPSDQDWDQAGDWREQELPSPGKTPVPDLTSTPSITITPTPTASPGPIQTQTIMPARTFTATASSTPSSQPTLEPVPTSTKPPFPTQAPTATGTMEPTPTGSPVPSATILPSPTVFPTGIGTGSPTPAGSPSPTPGAPGSSTPALSPTPSVVWTNTATPEGPTPEVPSPDPSASVSPTASPVPLLNLICNEIHADPHPENGDANRDGVRSSDDDEFIELVNLSKTTLDLTGWTISDAVRIRFRFPDGSRLKNQCAAVVFGGGSPSGAFGGSLVYAAGSLGLNNSGDQITIKDAGGVIMLSCSYGSEGGQDQSLTRSPDLSSGAMIPHRSAPGSAGRYFSPGTRLDGQAFDGCP